MSTQISESTWNGLRQSMSGDVIAPGHSAYDEARKIWNGDVDRRPALIARCKTVEDVRAALAFGRAQGLPIAVKAGGHSLPGHSCTDGSLMIDIRAMNGVTVDPAARRATVQGGAIWSEVDGPAQAHGLAVTGGHVSHTGVAGLTLGGGIGHLMRKLGLTVDNLESVKLMTADGRMLEASATENQDLFWALRGGCGNFGIALELVLRLTPIGPVVLGGLAFWAPEHGPELMRRYRELCANCPDDLNTLFVHLHAPPFDFVPKDVQMKPGYGLAVLGTDIAVAEKHLKSFRAFGPPLFDIIGPMPYLAMQGMFDPALPHGTRCYIKSHYIDELSDDVIRAIHENTPKTPPGRSQSFLIQMGGAVSRVPDNATAFAGRGAAFQTMFVGIWEDDAGRAPTVQWARDFSKSIEPFGHGSYVNLTEEMKGAELERTYGPEKFAKLRAIKSRYDPENVFRLNQNIPPA